MSDEGVYRPLYVLVEAIEAEIRRKLAPTQALARMDREPTVEDYQKGIRLALRDDSIHLRRDPWDTKMIVGHRCSVCHEFHQIKVNEPTYPKQEFVEKLVKETKALLEKPCNIELRTPAALKP